MSNEKWAFCQPFILSVHAPNGLKLINHRRVSDGIF